MIVLGWKEGREGGSRSVFGEREREREREKRGARKAREARKVDGGVDSGSGNIGCGKATYVRWGVGG